MEKTPTSNSETETSRSRFFEFTTTRPVAILMVVLAVVVFGWISYQQLPVNLMPDISYPSLTVRTEYPGTAPEEVETTVSRPIEQALGVVNHLVSISSISKAGQSDVKLEFTWDTDMDQATADVREKLDQVFLPEDAERPLILRFDPSLDPIMRLGLYGDASLIYMRYLADEEIKRILETIDGVAAVKVKGGLEEEIRVELNEQQLTLIGINIQQVENRLAQENVNLAGGNLKEGQTEYLVRTLNEFKTVDEIGDVVIGNFNGKEIKIRDVAQVKRTFKDREIITRLNQKESVEIEIFKEADANLVDVARRVKDRVFGTPEQRAFAARLKQMEQKKTEGHEAASDGTNGKKKKRGRNGKDGLGAAMRARMMTNYIAHDLPEGINIDLLSDQSVFIQNSVDEVKSTAVLGGILAIAVLFIFLRNLSATAIVGIAIPISIVATFAPMKIFGVSLNIMSLGGLALGIGMLVDNSIVVLESIARCREEGDGLIQATVRGVSEVGGAVTASTLTTVAVFFPIVFVQGVAGQVFGNMALTVVFSLCASLGVALFLIPMLSSRQSAKFVSGIDTGQVLQHTVFRFGTEDKVDELLAGGGAQGWGAQIWSGVRLFFSNTVLVLQKAVTATAALLLAFFKFVLTLLLLPALPLVALARILRLTEFEMGPWLAAFAERPAFLRVRFVENLWPTFLVIGSVPAFLADLRGMGQGLREAGWKRRVLRAGVLPFKSAFALLKFLFQFALELSFRFLHVLFVLGGVFFKWGVLQIRLVFSPLAQLVTGAFNRAYARLEAAYPRLLQRALARRGTTLGVVAALFLFCILILAPRLGSELIPEVHQGEFNVEVTMPVGTPVEKTDAKLLEIEKLIADQPGVDKVAAVSGTDRTANTTSEEGEHTAKLTVRMKRASSVVREEEELVERIRELMSNFSGIQWKISRPVLFSFKTPVEVEIQGYNLQELQRFSRELEEKMREIPGVFDVESNIQRGNPEVQIVYNRDVLSKLGLNIRDVAAIVRNKVRGDVATEFKEQDRQIDILVRLQERDRESIEDLRRLVINPGAPKPIPLEAVAAIRVEEGPSEIRRVDQQRTAVVTANISGRDLRSVSEDIYAVLRGMDLPPDFTYRLAGQNQEMETSLNSLKLALALAIFLVYIVMASQFESVIHPLVIIFTIPLALIGVIIALFLLQIPLSIVVFLGMIMLAGIVVNNAIVLVDYINKLRERGMAKMEAIVEAGKVRLRPIMMTTATTVLGLLPMALGLGDGAEIRTPMAITVIVGLLSATVLTLVIIPTVYSLVDRRN